MKVTFFGGAKSVTGANHLIEVNGLKILVDCGMKQGGAEAEKWNYNPFLYDPASIDYLFVTHAHIDHIGRIPKLVRQGFKGKIIATAPTIDLAKPSLRDSAGIIAHEAERFGLEPYFDMNDVKTSERLFVKHNYHDVLDLGSGVKVKIFNAGHVLGSAMYRFEANGKSITFTGDLGNTPSPLIPAPDEIDYTDYLVTESVYGDRNHDPAHIGSKLLKEIVLETIERGGTLMIPSFSLERSQIVLFYLNNMIENKEIASIPVFLDSPLAIEMTEVFRKHSQYFNDEVKKQIHDGDDIFAFPHLEFTDSVDESKHINEVKGSKIVIAGNGMSTAGRILHHEKRYLPDPKSTALIVGYQTHGSLGRQLLEGAKEVRIHHETIPVRAHIHQITAFSAHADQRQLMQFVEKNIHTRPETIFIVQGEEDSAMAFADKLKEQGFNTSIPDEAESVEL